MNKFVKFLGCAYLGSTCSAGFLFGYFIFDIEQERYRWYSFERIFGGIASGCMYGTIAPFIAPIVCYGFAIRDRE